MRHPSRPELTRRQFVAAGASLPFALQAVAEQTSHAHAHPPRWVLLGTDTGAGIYRATWDAATGKLGPRELAIAADHPSFLARHPSLPVLYCTNEVGDGNGAISSFKLHKTDATLAPLNKVATRGSAPCFIGIDARWKTLLAANYTSGSVACFPMHPDGTLADASDVLSFPDDPHGPNSDRQESTHMHCAVVAPQPEYVLCCDLGDDVIRILRLHDDRPDAAAGHRVPDVRQQEAVQARPGSGPRHLAFHPNGKWLYCIHELDCTIDLFDWSPASKPMLRFRDGSVVHTLRPGTPLTGNTGCELLISPDGRFAYACTRGVNEITIYRIYPKTGMLAEQQRFSCGGAIPRYIAFDPSRRWLVSCNQAAPGSVTVFAHDPATGRVDETPQTFAANTPMFIEWI